MVIHWCAFIHKNILLTATAAGHVTCDLHKYVRAFTGETQAQLGNVFSVLPSQLGLPGLLADQDQTNLLISAFSVGKIALIALNALTKEKDLHKRVGHLQAS